MRIWPVLAAAIIALLGNVSIRAQDVVQVGVIVDCPNSGATQLIEQVMSEARRLVRSNYTLELKPENTLQSDCDGQKVQANFERLLADPNIDMILSLDALSSHIMAQNGPYNKPVLPGIVINAQVQNIPITNRATSGIKNLSYVELPYSPMRDLEIFHTMIEFDKVALMMDRLIFEGIPEIKDFMVEQLDAMEIDYGFIFTDGGVSGTLDQITEEFDAIYFFPSDVLNDQEYQQLIEAANERQLLSFSVLGRLDVDRGVLAGVAPASNIELLSRRLALNIQRILNDEDAEDINVKLLQKEELVINMATARQIDYSPSWEVLSEAILINKERDDIDRSINLYSAIAEGLENNLNIEVAERDVEIVEEDLNVAKSRLLPEFGAGATHTIVDENTAEGSFGRNPRNTTAASLQLSQVIYSEQVTAAKQIQQSLLKASEASLEAQSLDIVLEVSTSYLNLMQTITAENIRKQNLEVTRKNLELARLSSALGQTGPSDLFRWQGEIATAKSDLLNATALRRQAELQLNQVLNRPVGEEFTTEEIDINDARILVNNEVTSEYVSNPKQFYRYADFMVSRAKRNAPNLKRFDYNLRAQERQLLLNKRNRYVPQVTLGGQYNYQFYRGGAGSEVPDGFPPPEDWNWNLQFGASLPIFQGGERTALVQQSRVQLMQLNTQRLNTERIIEQQVRSELENIRASYTNIQLTKDAEEAVTRNFQLVQDAYSKGTVTITQLLDAQNAALVGIFNSTNAIYIFLVDLLNLERATGSYYMLMTDEEKADYSAQLTEFFNQN